MLIDSYNRPISDLRVSVTDRCNFKCFYCKSATVSHFLERKEILTYEEIERLVRVFAALGIEKVRITGGEPLLRRNLEELIRLIAPIDGIRDIALTTNGFNFFEKGPLLKAAGLQRVTISLDSLRRDRFEKITRSRQFEQVLRSIEAACQLNLRPVKVNCVVIRGFNDDEVLDFAHLARNLAVSVRFIEFMPLDEDENWTHDQVVTGAEILERLQQELSLEPIPPENPSQTSHNYLFSDAPGKVGFINPVSEPFCGQCSRIRLTADGKIRTCLFSLQEHDLRERLRDGSDDRELEQFLRSVVRTKEKGHRINKPDFVVPPRSMSYIGG